VSTDPSAEATARATQTDDEKQLADLGYKQELSRAWSGFTNFAISFTIISVLAGPLTNFSFAWNAGGPAAIAWTWPILCIGVLFVALSMAELTSAYPTAGGPYWWAAKLGGKTWSWFTGWFNIIGVVGIVAGVGYGAAIFLNATLSLYEVDVLGVNFADDAHVLPETFLLFVIILIGYTVLNIFGDRVLALFNNISVGWHVLGVVVIIALLVIVPDSHQSVGDVFGKRINEVGFDGGATSGAFFWIYVLPLGFILTMYTMTGYDASAHTAEETRNAAVAAAQGVWRSVFYSALIGWVLLLAILFAITDIDGVTKEGGTAVAAFSSALTPAAAKAVLIIATIGQLFCGAAGLTSASRTWYAFSRDRGIPGWTLFRRVNRDRVPIYAVIAVSVFALVITIPANWGNDLGVPFAYVAITGICTVGLYLAYIIPVYLRFRARDRFEPGPWTLGQRYRWINIGAMVFVVIVVITLDVPTVHTAVPWNDDFDVTSFNYTPLVLLVGLIVAVWWQVSAKNRYTGPVRTIDELEDEMAAAAEGSGKPPEAGPSGPTPAATG
jgi:amino acid transporter